ncbi:Helicase associated domain protein [Kitasatospora sp. NPDC054939]
MTSAPLAPAIPGPRPHAPQLRPYQREAVTAIAAGLAGGGPGQWHACCGSGKTLVAQRAAEDLLGAAGTVAVLAPSLSLVAQTLASWRRHTLTGPIDALAVCSDDTVADAGTHLADLKTPVSTDPQHIADWLRTPATGRRLVVGTYQSADRLAAAVRATEAPLDLLVLDEAHHLTGRPEATTRRCVDRRWLPAHRSLYLTATPRLENVRADTPTLTMSDTAVFGPVLHSYPAARGIAEGYLEDYRIAVVGLRDHEARAMLADPGAEYVDRPGAPALQTVVAQAALIKAREQFGLRRALTFHHRVDAAAEFARTLPATAARLGHDPHALYAGHVHGEMTHAVRGSILSRLADVPDGQWAAVASARCLSEGLDVPAVDAVLFAHPKESAVDIIQAVGRALRRHPDTAGPSTIIVPLVVPDTDGEVGDLDAGDFRTLWQVIRALRAHDEQLGAALDYRRSNLSVSNPQLPAKITVVMPDGTSQRVIDQLTVLTVRQSTSAWWEALSAARAFHAEHGHLNVPTRYVTADGTKLGSWISVQRKSYAKGWLREQHIAELEKLGIAWDVYGAQFAAGLAALRAFHAEHGHTHVPQRHRSPDGFGLGMWLSNQRQKHRQGRLGLDNARALEELGVTWRGAGVERGMAVARAFHAEHGHLRVPKETVYHGLNLSQWLAEQRTDHRNGTLNCETARELERMGLQWAPHDARFAAGLAAARAFHAEHGHLNVPDDTIVGDLNLTAWIQRRRNDHHRGRLSPERTAALDELGIAWSPHDDKWHRGLAAARAFHAEHGHLRPPAKTWFEGVQLSAWVVARRKEYHEGKLPTQRVTALEDIGMQWTVRFGPAHHPRRSDT